MDATPSAPHDALIVALPETAGSALYGMLDVLAATGTLWEELSGREGRSLIRPRIVGHAREPFRCGNGIPVVPDFALDDAPAAGIVILPELWLAPDDPIRDRYPDLLAWVRARHRGGASIYAACSGAVLLAATGLLDGREATSHWGYQDLFRRHYPRVRFRPEPNLAFAEPAGRIVTAGGSTSWHDLAIHIVARHCGPGTALRVAKAHLLKWHGEGQLPYATLVRTQPHADSAVRRAEDFLTAHFSDAMAVSRAVEASGIAERTLKRRFKAATGSSLMAYAQNLRIEDAKRRLEGGAEPFEAIAAAVGYDNPAFARRLFRRATGLTPGQYRRMFRPFAAA